MKGNRLIAIKEYGGIPEERFLGIRGGEGYSDNLLTILWNVHSFLCLLQATKDGIFKNSNMS